MSEETDLAWLSSDPEWVRKHSEPEYPEVNSGPLCGAEESGYLDSTNVFCPFGRDGECTSGCPSNRERYCLLAD